MLLSGLPDPRVLAACIFFAACPAFAQTIDPADYGNITLHLTAGTLALADNAAVTTWGPLSWPPTMAGTSAPIYVASDARFNGKPVVKFGSADKHLLAWTGAHLKARTVFAVVALESDAPSHVGVLSNGSDGLNIRRKGATLFYRSPEPGTDAKDFVGGAPGGMLSVNNVPHGAYAAGAPHLIIAAAGRLQTYADLWLGNAGPTLARWLSGSIAEVIVYDGVLTQPGLDDVGYYLQTKYHLPTNFPTPSANVRTFSATAAGLTAEDAVLSSPGAPVTLAWEVMNATTISIDQGVLASSPARTGTAVVSPSTTTTYTLTATGPASSTSRTVTVYIGAATKPLALNEFLAENGAGLADEDGTRQDWVEIYNPNPFAVSTGGWMLADGRATWTFPNAGISGGEYLVVFASAKNRTNPGAPLHTNFKLSAGGEYLALQMPNGTVATEFAPTYPVQRTDVSSGLNGAAAAFYPTPTPGAANGASVSGFVAEPKFSVPRGFFSTPQTVAITCATPSAEIRYTTDHSTPTATNGSVFTAPLTISAPTVLRARAFKAGLAPSDTGTQTYLFVAEVADQGPEPAGWPASGVNGQALRYGFNATLRAQYPAAELATALAQLPSFSIVTDQANLTDAAHGIYVNALRKGDAWERAASVELLNPDGRAGFHIDAGLRIRGGYSRNDRFAKHSLRLNFRRQYGRGKIEYPLFGAEGAEEFQTIDLRAEQNYSWANDGGTEHTAVREVFCRDLFAAMGQATTRSQYYHVYLNGQYWGIYMTEERPQEDYGATYFGGAPEDYDVVQTSNHPSFTLEVASGTVEAWQQCWMLARECAANPTDANYFKVLGCHPDGTRNPAFPVYLDADHLATYMLLHYYTGDGDGPLSNYFGMNRANNWRGLRHRLGSAGFRFFVHDGEHTLLVKTWVEERATERSARGSNRGNFSSSNPEWLHEDLAANLEYRMKIGDVAQRHLCNGGALTPTKAQALFDARAAQIAPAIVADATRWGTSAEHHTLAQWHARLDHIRANFFPTRHTAVLEHLRMRGFYPSIDPPTFSPRVGRVSAGHPLTLTAGAQTGTIHYTLDGSDPRAIGGAVASGAQPYSGSIAITQNSTRVRARFRDPAGHWSALDEATFPVSREQRPRSSR